MPLRVLGIDLASSSWASNGSALLTFDRDRWRDARAPAIRCSARRALAPESLAEAIDAFALEEGLAAVSIDGPQGWRDPSAPPEQGAGRAADRAARTQGKCGEPGVCFPRTYLSWVSFSIELFDRLIALPHVRLANDLHEAARPIAHGWPSRRVNGHRVEGIIWDAAPAASPQGVEPVDGGEEVEEAKIHARTALATFGW